MRKVLPSKKYGDITYDENFWIGRKTVSIGGKPLKKLDKKTFETDDGKRVSVKGNYLYGVKMTIGEDEYQVTPTIKWYEVLLMILPFLLDIIWGNNIALCLIVPIVGGAIGGAISGLMSMVSLLFMRKFKPLWAKIGIAAVAVAATFGICAAIGYAILAAL